MFDLRFLPRKFEVTMIKGGQRLKVNIGGVIFNRFNLGKGESRIPLGLF